MTINNMHHDKPEERRGEKRREEKRRNEGKNTLEPFYYVHGTLGDEEIGHVLRILRGVHICGVIWYGMVCHGVELIM